ncbi:hypothetical protein [Acinetobacter sp. Ac_5812]|uniref:hypothetical protein n=1 Tax=Acinetobacter sp. Ac_5812 TaxID=1848937 RepID=UPI00149062DD|nr:hypothetical protein [Acinetobacter sp. Ac_5812]NNP68507.1 hypothetical protein [Acinetobacter sp. Ac_5812]
MKNRLLPIFFLGTIGLCLNSTYATTNTMQSMTDSEMSATTGQALMSLSYISPTDAANLEKNRSGGDQAIGFYKLGMEAELELNLNIKKLQLGCGGRNGIGCDIDLDNVSLSGNPAMVGNAATDAASDQNRANRVGSSAKLTNPFIEFAIKNPGQASLRQMVGFRVSSEKAQGLLTIGTENSNIPNGINALSGYIPVRSDSSGKIKGIIETAPSYFDASDPYNRISGKLNAPLGTVAQFHLDQGGFWIPGFKNVGFEIPGFTIKGNRMPTVLSLNPIVKLPDLVMGRDFNNNNCSGACNDYGMTSNFPVKPTYNLNSNTISDGNGTILSYANNGWTQVGVQGGVLTPDQPNTDQGIQHSLRAKVDSCSGIGCLFAGDSYYVNMYTRVRNVTANVTVKQPLGLIHSLPLNSGASLSLQSQNILWPGQPLDDITEPGWWLSIKDGVDLGTIVPTAPVNLCEGTTAVSQQCVHPQIAKQVRDFLAANPPSTSDLGGLISGNSALGIKVGSAGASGGIGLSSLGLTVNGLTLGNQYFTPNCYGSLKFC